MGSIQTDTWTGSDGVKNIGQALWFQDSNLSKNWEQVTQIIQILHTGGGESTVPNFEEVANGDDLPFP